MKEEVRKTYRKAIKATGSGLPDSSCCTADKALYEELLAGLPPEVRKMSFGCGNPLAVDAFRPGDIVADIGCGAGLDVLIAAQRVGPKGKAIGIDFTEEMLELAKQNAKKAGLANAEFLYGEADRLPLEDNFLSVAVSNCVLNLAPDKRAVFQEIARVLRPGGRLVVSDIVSEKELPEDLKRDPHLWSSCIGGAIPEEEYLALLHEAGLRGVVIFSRKTIDTYGQKLYSITFQAVKPDSCASYSFPNLIHLEKDGIHLFLRPDLPAWFSTNEMGARIVELCDGRISSKAIAPELAAEVPNKELREEFLAELDSRRIAVTGPQESRTYPGRGKSLPSQKLEELWLHTNNTCNSHCRHCLVSAGEKNKNELATEELLSLVEQGRALGTERFYLTGGEPFLRPDIFGLMESILAHSELVVLTNGTLLNKHKAKLSEFTSRKRLLFQISLEGPDAAVHDAIRGKDSFEAVVWGIKTLVDMGLSPVIATTLTSLNANHLAETSGFLQRLGIKHHHVLWLHQRGRATQNREIAVSPKRMIETMRELQKVSAELGISVDNFKAVSARLAGRQGRKYDLCHAACSTLAVGPEGQVFPCAAFVGESRFECGSVRRQTLAEIWAGSERLKEVRQRSVIHQSECRSCPLAFFCGGGCLSYRYFASDNLKGPDPYCEVYQEMFRDSLWELALPSRQDSAADRDGEPKRYAAMAPPFNPSGREFEVTTFHCACVLATCGSNNSCGC